MVDTSMKQSSNRLTEIICTLREGGTDDVEGDIDPPAQQTKYGPITLTYQGMHATLRPWDPYNCILAAAVHNCLLHFPIWPGSCVFALGCSLHTLGHIVDVLGNGGRLIGVIGEGQSQQPPPTSDELRKFFKRHPGASIVTENVQNASFERYQRLLSLPEASRYAFLMALHPRLGLDSPARKLSAAPAKLIQRIFSFLVCHDAADVKSLVVCHWPLGTRVDVVREVVLSHIDILSHWRRTIYNQSGAQRHEEGASKTTNAIDSRTRPEGSSKKWSDDDRESVPQWVLLDIPIGHISTNSPNQETEDMDTKLIEVVGAMKRLTSGMRTGLQAKEQLLLEPYFPKHVLLLLKYATHRDERSGKVSTDRRQAAEELAKERNGGGGSASATSTSASLTAVPLDHACVSAHQAPSAAAVPVLSFSGNGGSRASNAPSPSGSGPVQTKTAICPGRPNPAVAATGARAVPRARAAEAAAAAADPRRPPPGLADPHPHEPLVEDHAAGSVAASSWRADAKAVTWADPTQTSHELKELGPPPGLSRFCSGSSAAYPNSTGPPFPGTLTAGVGPSASSLATTQGGNMMMWMQRQGGCGLGPMMPQECRQRSPPGLLLGDGIAEAPFSNGKAGAEAGPPWCRHSGSWPVEDRGPQQLGPGGGSMPGNNSFGSTTQVPGAVGQATWWQPPAYMPHGRGGGSGRGCKGNFAKGHKNLRAVKHHAAP